MKVHVDCDVVAYRAGYAAEHTWYYLHFLENGKEYVREFDGAKAYKDFVLEKGLPPSSFWVENKVKVEAEEAALYNVRSILKDIASALAVDLETDILCYISGPDNYRNGVATLKPYKGNRDPTRKPVHAPAIKELLRNRYSAKVSDGQEADDDIASAHYAMWEADPLSSVIATIDKDLDMVPGLHYDFVAKESYDVSPEAGRYAFWSQMLTGDTVDNIPGVPKIGRIVAARILDKVGSYDDLALYEAVREEYVKAYGDKADEALLEMGRLLWIRHKGVDWWTPPSKES